MKCEIVMDRHPAHSIRLTSLRSNIHLATFHPFLVLAAASPLLLHLTPLTLPTRRLPIPRQRPHEILRADDAIPSYLASADSIHSCATLHHVALLLHRIAPSLHPTFRIISLASSSVKCTLVLFRPRDSHTASFSEYALRPLSHKFFFFTNKKLITTNINK